MTDDVLERLLRAAVPPMEGHDVDRDIWTRVAARFEQRPRWAWLDVGLAAVLAMLLLMFPECLSLLAHHF